jgi:hypothetical protein
MAEEGSRACKVSCGDVTLKITLTPKLLKKPFEEAVLAPFLKAYSKKVGGRLLSLSDQLYAVHFAVGGADSHPSQCRIIYRPHTPICAAPGGSLRRTASSAFRRLLRDCRRHHVGRSQLARRGHPARPPDGRNRRHPQAAPIARCSARLRPCLLR